MARWLSWLERRPVTAEVDGSNPFRVVSFRKLFQFLLKRLLFLLNILLKEEIVNYNICGLIRKTFEIKLNYIYNKYKQFMYSYCNEILANN